MIVQTFMLKVFKNQFFDLPFSKSSVEKNFNVSDKISTYPLCFIGKSTIYNFIVTVNKGIPKKTSQTGTIKRGLYCKMQINPYQLSVILFHRVKLVSCKPAQNMENSSIATCHWPRSIQNWIFLPLEDWGGGSLGSPLFGTQDSLKFVRYTAVLYKIYHCIQTKKLSEI